MSYPETDDLPKAQDLLELLFRHAPHNSESFDSGHFVLELLKEISRGDGRDSDKAKEWLELNTAFPRQFAQKFNTMCLIHNRGIE